jgi:hypothetical protein
VRVLLLLLCLLPNGSYLLRNIDGKYCLPSAFHLRRRERLVFVIEEVEGSNNARK